MTGPTHGEESDLVLAVVTDVIHAHQNGQKLPVFLKVQALDGEEALRYLHSSTTGSQNGVRYLISSQRVDQMSGLSWQVTGNKEQGCLVWSQRLSRTGRKRHLTKCCVRSQPG